MSNIEEIEQVVEKLPLQDFVRLAAWVDQRHCLETASGAGSVNGRRRRYGGGCYFGPVPFEDGRRLAKLAGGRFACGFHGKAIPTGLDCLEQNLLRRRLGMVDQSDAGQLKQVWANEIRLRF